MHEDREIRTFALSELRIEDGEKPKIRGYASVFNQESEDLGGFREIVRPGAFKKTIQESDIRALFNHDANYVLGRKKTGTLVLEEDERGLKIVIDPPETTWAKDLLTSIRRGDIDQMSFGFKTVKDEWEKRDSQTFRYLVEAKLFDISPVTFPAYPQTSVAVRSQLDKIAKESAEPIQENHSQEPNRDHSVEPIKPDHSSKEPVAVDHSHRAELARVENADRHSKTLEVE
ncbi:MAG: HK97 family phage prohead protease [Dehalococcoidia bacterium]|jgi:hypothetical protein